MAVDEDSSDGQQLELPYVPSNAQIGDPQPSGTDNEASAPPTPTTARAKTKATKGGKGHKRGTGKTDQKNRCEFEGEPGALSTGNVIRWSDYMTDQRDDSRWHALMSNIGRLPDHRGPQRLTSPELSIPIAPSQQMLLSPAEE